MIPLFKAALSSAAVLVNLASCPAAQAPDVRLSFKNLDATYINDKSSADLGRFRSDTVFSHGPDEIFTTGGLTQSNIAAGVEYNYKTLTDPQSGNACLWLTQLDIKISYTPRVYIASGFRPGSCRYGITLGHENRHVATDLATLNEYLPRLKDAVAAVTASVGAQGPAPKGEIERARGLFASVVRTELQKQMNAMERARLQRQQAIDTREEYLRLSRACPREPVPGK